MSSYVLSFRNRSDRTTDANAEAEWGQWFQEIGGAIVDFGHRVGRVSHLGNARRKADGDDVLSGYVVITADDLESAVALASGCPGLRYGGGVEVGEAIDAS